MIPFIRGRPWAPVNQKSGGHPSYQSYIYKALPSRRNQTSNLHDSSRFDAAQKLIWLICIYIHAGKP